ncbi:unnamed protein product [Effrenium voratum]|nr:unnamed protein product [Effrenium voratum]
MGPGVKMQLPEDARRLAFVPPAQSKEPFSSFVIGRQHQLDFWPEVLHPDALSTLSRQHVEVQTWCAQGGRFSFVARNLSEINPVHVIANLEGTALEQPRALAKGEQRHLLHGDRLVMNLGQAHTFWMTFSDLTGRHESQPWAELSLRFVAEGSWKAEGPRNLRNPGIGAKWAADEDLISTAAGELGDEDEDGGRFLLKAGSPMNLPGMQTLRARRFGVSAEGGCFVEPARSSASCASTLQAKGYAGMASPIFSPAERRGALVKLFAAHLKHCAKRCSLVGDDVGPLKGALDSDGAGLFQLLQRPVRNSHTCTGQGGAGRLPRTRDGSSGARACARGGVPGARAARGRGGSGTGATGVEGEAISAKARPPALEPSAGNAIPALHGPPGAKLAAALAEAADTIETIPSTNPSPGAAKALHLENMSSEEGDAELQTPSGTVTTSAELGHELPSLGSAGHATGDCKRCCFYPKGRCQNGYECRFCHFDHDKRKRVKKSGEGHGPEMPANLMPPTPNAQCLANGIAQEANLGFEAPEVMRQEAKREAVHWPIGDAHVAATDADAAASLRPGSMGAALPRAALSRWRAWR